MTVQREKQKRDVNSQFTKLPLSLPKTTTQCREKRQRSCQYPAMENKPKNQKNKLKKKENKREKKKKNRSEREKPQPSKLHEKTKEE